MGDFEGKFEDNLELLLGAPGWKPEFNPDGSWYFRHIKSNVTALWPGGPFVNPQTLYEEGKQYDSQRTEVR
jgi:hypothetical protein